MENNLEIKQKTLIAEQDRNTLNRSKYDFLPSVSGSVNHNFNWGRSVDMQELVIIQNRMTQATSASIGTSIVVFDGLNKWNTVRSNSLTLQISIEQIEKLKNDISANITRAYLQLLLSIEIYNNAAVNYESILSQVEKAEKLVQSGSSLYGSFLEISAQAASEKANLVSAKNDITLNRLELKQMLDLYDDDSFEVEYPDMESEPVIPYSFSCIELFREALSLPQIKSGIYDVENKRVQLAIAKGEYFPTISLSAGYGTYFSDAAEGTFNTQFYDNRNPSVSITISIPILNGLQRVTNSRNARLSLKYSETAFEMEKIKLYKEIQNAVTLACNQYEELIASKEKKKAMEELLRITEKKLEYGAVTANDYITARTNMLNAVSQYYRSKYQYLFQIKIIEFYRKGNYL